MSEQHPGGIPAGWYEDPQSAQTLRYWDGSRWTDSVEPLGDTPLPATPAGPTEAAPGTAASVDVGPGFEVGHEPGGAAAGGSGRTQGPGFRSSMVDASGSAQMGSDRRAGVLFLAGLGLVIARPWDTTPETCAEAVSALAGRFGRPNHWGRSRSAAAAWPSSQPRPPSTRSRLPSMLWSQVWPASASRFRGPAAVPCAWRWRRRSHPHRRTAPPRQPHSRRAGS